MTLPKLLLAGLLTLASQAQTFEAASVRPAQAGDRTGWKGGPGTRDPGQIVYTAVSLLDLIEQAYDLDPYQIKGGPSWLASERFTVIAKLPGGATKRDLRLMLQDLLAGRFKLAVHRETQEGRNYRLSVDKGGPRLKPPTDGTPASDATVLSDENGGLKLAENSLGRPVTLAGKNMLLLVGNGEVHILAHSQTMTALASDLTRLMGGPVSDATGLTGTYDFSLDFALPPESRIQTGLSGEPIMPIANAEPPLTVFQALKEKLGLRLDVNRGPLEILIVEQAERVPTGN